MIDMLLLTRKVYMENLRTTTRRTACTFIASLPLALKTFAAEHNMFLALNSVLLSGRVPWPDFAKLAAKTGYPGTDIMLGPAMKEGLTATRDLLAELKIKPAAIDFPVEFRKDDAAFAAGLEKLKQAAPFASAIGCPRMVTYILSSSPMPKEELRATYKKRFSEAARILADSNVRLGLEFLGPLHIRKAFPNEFIWRMNEMLEFAESCGPNVGLLLDAWHWHTAGATTDDILRAGKDRIVHIHFDDAPDLPPEQIRDNERLLPGEGVINLTGFLQALDKIGYRDALSVEVFGRLKNDTPEDAARKGLEASLGVFKKAHVAEG
jgi:sugar phosphate isomerase/epimerase